MKRIHFQTCLALLLATLTFHHADLFAADPAPKQNYFPLVIVNNTTQPAANVFFVAHANDPNGIPCFLVPDNTGVCQYTYPNPHGTVSSITSSISLSQLPPATNTPFSAGGNAYLCYIPVCSSGRAYFSINNKMYLATQLNPALSVLGVIDANSNSYTDPNFYTLWQIIEFGLVNVSSNTNSQLGLYFDLSWVDFFSLPMQLYTYSYPSNNIIAVENPFTVPSGTIPGMSRQTILNSLSTKLAASNSASWESIGVPFYSNPYVYSQPSTYVRFLAAKNSLALATSTPQFNFPGQPTSNACPTPTPPTACSLSYPSCNPPMFRFFCPEYLTNTAMGPGGTQSYMQAVYQYYYNSGSPRSFYAEIVPAGTFPAGTHTVYQISANATNLTLTFTCVNPISTDPNAGPDFSLLLGNSDPTTGDVTNGGLTTELLLGGSGDIWPFVKTGGNIPSGSTQVAYQKELAKLVSGLFSIGNWPFPTATGPSVASPCNNLQGNYPTCTQGTSNCPFFNGNCGFNYLSYFPSPFPLTGFTGGPWNNVYCQALHELMISSKTSQVCLAGCNPPCSGSCVPCSNGCVPSNPTLGLGYAYDFDDLLNMAGLIGGIPTQDQYGNPPGTTGTSQPYFVVALDIVETSSIPVLFSTSYQYPVKVSPAPNGATVTFSYYTKTGTNAPVQHMVTASPTDNTDLGTVYVDSTHLFQMTYSFTSSDLSYSYNYQATFTLDLQHQVAIPTSTTYTSTDQAYQTGIQFSVDPSSTPGNPSFLIQYNSTPPSWPG